ncbi:leucine-rich repeat flightless-interacting protein 1 isoform X7 [Erythrolamprus reginae]|uniref:leucine-rich repeat flightless-interacting protein 1 isoform X7 n=1 Tax=Erythrolamprus reginae TaxID=121349 RepID=UPI00396CAD5D
MENSGTPQGTAGRKRTPNRERPTAEDEALNLIAREGEARLAAKRAARAEAREIRMKELEKQQQKPTEYSYYLGSGSQASSRTSSAHASPLVEERFEKDFEKDSLTEVEEKYKKAMVSNAQLDNEKTNFMYQVETLQDALLELEEQLAECKRQFEDKSKDFEREKHAHSILQFQFMELKEALKQKEELLAEIRQLQQNQEGFVREITDLQETIEWKEKKIGALERQKVFFDSLRSERDDFREEVILLNEQLKQYAKNNNLGVAANGEISNCVAKDGLSNSSKVISEASHAFKVSEDCTEDFRLKRLLDEREFLLLQIKKLKGQLEEKQNNKIEKLHLEDEVLQNGPDMHVVDLQRDANRQISDLKFKLTKSEQEITTLEQNNWKNTQIPEDNEIIKKIYDCAEMDRLTMQLNNRKESDYYEIWTKWYQWTKKKKLKLNIETKHQEI